jgi:Phosphodiester glycosidase
MPTPGHLAAARGSAPRGRRTELPPLLTPGQRLRRVVWLTIAICLVPIVISFGTTMAGPSNSSFTINAFEWLRDHGGAGIATTVESWYYSMNAPSTGGPALRRLSLRTRAASQVHPRDITPAISPPLSGEGVWVPTETWSGTNAPVQITQFRSDPNYPQMVAGVAWIDPRRTSIVLYPGQLEPSVTIPNRGPEEVPPALRSRLLATFNSGFKLEDSHGGFAVGGRTYASLQPGMATFVHYTDGRVDILDWKWGPRNPAGVDYARQNLPLIVDGGRPNPNLSDGPEWGATLGNAVRVWRSGIGIDAHGDLIYAAANDQTVGSLADILIRAGAVRAMQLDINSYWVTFNSYARQDAGDPSSLLPAMTRPSTRYLSPDDRDFFAVYLR